MTALNVAGCKDKKEFSPLPIIQHKMDPTVDVGKVAVDCEMVGCDVVGNIVSIKYLLKFATFEDLVTYIVLLKISSL